VSVDLSSEERASYRQLGFFVRPAVLTEPELVPLRAAVENIHTQIVGAGEHGGDARLIDDKRYQEVLGSTVKWEWAEGSAEVRSMEPFHHLDARIDRLIDDPRLWQPLLGLLECDGLSLFTDKLNFKRPQGSPFPWHQDTPYWAFGCEHTDQLVSLQLYLDDANKENGCLWVIPGSNRHGALPVYEDRGVLGRLYTDLDGADLGTPQPLEAPAGSILYFDGNVVHGSQTNRTQSSRRAIVLTYQPAGHPRWNHPQIRPVP